MSGIVAGELLDEEHLYTNAPKSAGNSHANDSYLNTYHYSTGDTSSTNQLVLVAPAILVRVSNDTSFDNHLKLDVYRADIQSDGSVSDWTKVLSNQNYNDKTRYLSANIDQTAADSDTDLTSAAVVPFAIAWKFVTKPYGGTWFNNKSRCHFFVGNCGIQEATFDGKGTIASSCTYDDNYKGKKLLLLRSGFRVAYTGAYKDDSPGNYVTFQKSQWTARDYVNTLINLFGGDKDVQTAARIGAGDTVVYLPTGA